MEWIRPPLATASNKQCQARGKRTVVLEPYKYRYLVEKRSCLQIIFMHTIARASGKLSGQGHLWSIHPTKLVRIYKVSNILHYMLLHVLIPHQVHAHRLIYRQVRFMLGAQFWTEIFFGGNEKFAVAKCCNGSNCLQCRVPAQSYMHI